MMHQQAALPPCIEIEVCTSHLIQMYWSKDVWSLFDWMKKNIAEGDRFHIVTKGGENVRRVNLGKIQQIMAEKHKHEFLKDLTRANLDDPFVALLMYTSWQGYRQLRLINEPLPGVAWTDLPDF